MMPLRIALFGAYTLVVGCWDLHGGFGVEAIGSLICEPGSFLNPSGTCQLCPGGTYGSQAGLINSSCSGVCTGGYFCPPGSTSPRAKPCGNSRFFCPTASAMRLAVQPGFYTIQEAKFAQTPTQPFVLPASAQTACERGFFCIDGVRRPCPAGTFGNVEQLQSSLCSGLCPKGSFCPVGTNQPVPCPAGTYGNTLGLSTADCSALCPVGFYCESGTIVPKRCPAGVFGSVQGLQSKACSATCTSPTDCVPSPCPAGFFCPLATVTPTACGDVSVFCPEGSKSPTTASLGYYTIWQQPKTRDDYVQGSSLMIAHQDTRSAQVKCEKGTYCINGVKFLCPQGYYGDQEGLASSTCSGKCPAGYYCPIGSMAFDAHPCTARNSYCLQGSSSPTIVSTGYYTVLDASGQLRINQAICPIGSFCVNGIAHLCPAGTYADTQGVSSPHCSGNCQDGYICPSGSTTMNAQQCSAGTYAVNGVRCLSCSPGFWCSAGSTDPQQNKCGGDQFYCPLGSSTPRAVATGNFASGQTPQTHVAQQLCLVRDVVHLPQCPTITSGVNSGL